MKRSLLLPVLLALMLFSCNKAVDDNVPSSLEGSWKMILVKDNATHTTLTKPSSIPGDVIITFVPDTDTTGTFSGNTPSNVFTGFYTGANTYTPGSNRSISIPVLSMTKVGETSWGEQFVDNIRDAQQYNFGAAGILNIRTVYKMLTFKKQ